MSEVIFQAAALSTGQQVALTQPTVEELILGKHYYFDRFIAPQGLFSRKWFIGKKPFAICGQIDRLKELPFLHLLGGEFYFVKEIWAPVVFYEGIWYEIPYDWQDYADDYKAELCVEKLPFEHIIEPR